MSCVYLVLVRIIISLNYQCTTEVEPGPQKLEQLDRYDMRSDERRMTGINGRRSRIILDTCAQCECATAAVSAISGDYAQSHKHSVYHPPYVAFLNAYLTIRISQIS